MGSGHTFEDDYENDVFAGSKKLKLTLEDAKSGLPLNLSG